MWTMLHDKSAIEAMALTVRFGEPLGSVVGRRVLGELETASTKEGMEEKQALQGLQMVFDPMGGGLRAGAPTGMVFRRVSLEKQGGESIPVLSAQTAFQNEFLQYHTYRYQGWDAEKPTIMRLFSVPLQRAADAVPFTGIRLEYLNRFIFDGDRQDVVASKLLKSHAMLAEHIFSAPDMWHSHSGKFDQLTDQGRRLVQVNADLLELAAPHPKAGRRSLVLMIATEQQFHPPGREVPPGVIVPELEATLEQLHNEISALFLGVLNAEFARKSGLQK
jgi:uncharacterized protein (TIGR04255 family)